MLIGAAQLVQRDTPPAEALSPLDMMEETARAAAADAGLGARALRELDTVALVDVLAWRPLNGARLVAERLGARPRRELVSTVGGEMPLVLVNRVARRIAAGEAGLALVTGANAIRTLRRARDARVRLDWPSGGAGEAERVGFPRGGTSPAEVEYGLGRPTDIYPIFENALRARRGASIEEHQLRVGRLMARLSEVASRNPHAWFPTARSAREIATPGPGNRMVAFPYTKYMNAVIETDQAAAVLLASARAARALGVPEERQVHWWGGAERDESPWYPSERPDFSAAPALETTARRALAEAGVGVADLEHLDFYSCFPVAVELACEHLGIAEDDPRGLTVTGGLPYAGGPGNAYTLHALAAMVERIRERRGSRGLVTGNGWYLTKHSATVLAGAPRETAGWPRAAEPAAPPPDGEHTASTDAASGPGCVETYTVLYDRDGAPVRGIVLGRTDAGRRFLANTPDDRRLLEAFAAAEQVGARGRVSCEEGRNRFEPA